MNLEQKYKEHYEKHKQIAMKINELTTLVNELGEMPYTGVQNIDSVSLALDYYCEKLIDLYIEVEDGV